MLFFNKEYLVSYFDTNCLVMLCFFKDKVDISSCSSFKELANFYGKEKFIKI